MDDSFNRSPNVVGDRDTHPPIATSETTPRKQKNAKMQHPHLPLESLPSTESVGEGAGKEPQILTNFSLPSVAQAAGMMRE